MCSALDKPIHQCSDVGVIATTATKLLAATAGFCAMKRTFDVERSCLSGVIGIGLVLAEKKASQPHTIYPYDETAHQSDERKHPKQVTDWSNLSIKLMLPTQTVERFHI